MSATGPRLTIFAIPKAFKGRFDRIQRNAITSWTQLQPTPEVILFGDDAGTAELAAEFGLKHEPEVVRNEYGTPRVDGMFARAQGIAANDVLVYVNSDIILQSDFVVGVGRVLAEMGDQAFLGVGRKTTFPIERDIDFASSDWEPELRAEAAAKGAHVTYDSDFFVFRRGLWNAMPPFAIGRCYWSTWFMWDVRRRGIRMVDMTSSVLTIESKHDYSHALSTGGHSRLSGVEYEANRRLFKGCHYYTTVNATDVLTADGLSKPPSRNRRLNITVRSEYWVYFMLKGRLYPWSLPLILSGRWLRSGIRALAALPKHALRPS